MFSSKALTALLLAISASGSVSALPSAEIPAPELVRVQCNTSIPVRNPACKPDYACIPDPDRFCIEPVPNPCLDGMCVPYLKGRGCGGFVVEPNECKKKQVCVENVIEGCSDCKGVCVWEDGRDAQIGIGPK